jgi:hypothetical protein
MTRDLTRLLSIHSLPILVSIYCLILRIDSSRSISIYQKEARLGMYIGIVLHLE